ncbi:hypothetical protein Syun_009974 [Stephania yunnanensis]|uniref:Uncharacterized protein n=1 Tax=Stephania yunnanensis TaxID=152371 RepID=A0AAP0KI75_9MAGN
MANGGHHKKRSITSVGRGLDRALAIEMARRGHTVFASLVISTTSNLGLILYSDLDHRHILFHLDVRDDEVVSLFVHNAIGLVGVSDIIGQRSGGEAGLLRNCCEHGSLLDFGDARVLPDAATHVMDYGAFFADAYLGRFKTIVSFSCIYAVMNRVADEHLLLLLIRSTIKLVASHHTMLINATNNLHCYNK